MEKEKTAPLTYHFKNKKVKKAFLLYAMQVDKSGQELITDALKAKYPKLIK